MRRRRKRRTSTPRDEPERYSRGSSTVPTPHRNNRRSIQMGKGLILWLLGVPGFIVLLLLFTNVI